MRYETTLINLKQALKADSDIDLTPMQEYMLYGAICIDVERHLAPTKEECDLLVYGTVPPSLLAVYSNINTVLNEFF